MSKEPEVPPPWVNGPEVPQDRPLAGSFRNGGAAARAADQVQSSDRDERRLVATVVRLVMRLPRYARWGLLAAALAGAGDLSGMDDVILRALFAPAPVEVPDRVRQPDRSYRDELRLERADGEALGVR